eukprot:UN11313
MIRYPRKKQAKMREELADMITAVPPAAVLGFCISRRIYLTSDQALELLDIIYPSAQDNHHCPERVIQYKPSAEEDLP